MPGVGTTHHIQLGDRFFLLRQGTYRKRPAPLFGSRFSTGDPDYNNLSFWQHWVQSCWIGGFGADTWRDDAMFDEGAGIDTTQHEVMMLTRDLVRAPGGQLDVSGAAKNYKREFFEFDGHFYVITYPHDGATSKLYRWIGNPTYAWTLERSFSSTIYSVAVFNNCVLFGDGGANFPRMLRDRTFVSGGVDKPDSVDDAIPFAMMVYRGRCYVGFGRQLWRLKPDFTWDGSTAFYTAEDVNRITMMEKHLGFLYAISANGHVLRTDANNTFDIWQFDLGINVVSVRSFDGRLFISTSEALEGTTAAQTVLYQFTGAAVTELKRWGKVGQDIITGKLRVWRNRLFFGAGSMLGMDDGFGVGAYDPREDSYHVWATNRDFVTWAAGSENDRWIVDDLAYFGGYLWCSVRGHGIFRTKSSYKDASRYLATYDVHATPGDASPRNGGWYTTSDFDAGTPGLMKLFNAVTIHVDLPTTAQSVIVEVSLDGGITWLNAGSDVTASKVGGIYHPTEIGRVAKTIKFPDGGFRGTRLKLRLTMKTTDLSRSPALRGVIVRYLPLPEPGWMWEFDLVVSDTQELLDGTQEKPNVEELSRFLDASYRSQSLLHFTDIDGFEWTKDGGKGVLLYQLEKQVPFSGPVSDGAIESIYRCTLIEAVEAY